MATERPGLIGVFTTDTTLAVRTWDSWLAGATGIPAAVARGRPLTELVPDLAARGLLAPFQQVLARGVVEVLAPSLHRYLIACPPRVRSTHVDCMQQRVIIGPLREDDRIVGAMVTIEDVTARVERERELAAQLANADPGARLQAVEALAAAEAVGAAAGDPLVDALGDEDWHVRRAAMRGLARRTGAGVVLAVLKALRQEHRTLGVVSSAVELLARSDLEVVAPLVELLRDPDVDLRLQAALVLGSHPDPRAIAALLGAIADPDDNVRFHAIEALGRLQASDAVDPLVAIAESRDFFLAFPALDALRAIGDPRVAPRLVPLLADDALRVPVTETLGQLGDEETVDPLVDLLNRGSAPADVVAGSLARLYDRYSERDGAGEHIADLVRRRIAPAGTQRLLDGVSCVDADRLRPLAVVLGWLEGPGVERALTRLLGHRSIRAKVVEVLVRHGVRVVGLLIDQLGSEDLETRQAAVVALGRIGDKRATGPLIGLLADPELAVATAGALARIGDAEAFEPLLALVGHPDAAVRQAVVSALNSIGHPALPDRLPPLLADPDARVRESAVRIAGYFGYPQCADLLLARCQDPEELVRRAAIEHLPFLEDPRVIRTLLETLRRGGPKLRSAAVNALGRLDAPEFLEPLLAALSDDNAWVRYFAARALAEHRDDRAVDSLARRAQIDPAGQVRLAAIEALGRTGSSRAVSVLGPLAAAGAADVAIAAIDALGFIAHADAWAPLEAALRADAADRRAAAARAIGRRGGSEALPALEWVAGADDSVGVARAAIDALGRIAAGGAVAAAAIRTLLGLAADPARCDAVVAVLAGLPAAQAAAMAAGLRDSRADVRCAVVRALGRMRHPDASRWLQTALADAVPSVRIAAITELRHLGTRGADRQLLALGRADPDGRVRRAALGALSRAAAFPARPEAVAEPGS